MLVYLLSNFPNINYLELNCQVGWNISKICLFHSTIKLPFLKKVTIRDSDYYFPKIIAANQKICIGKLDNKTL